jgi:hypothetical protein
LLHYSEIQIGFIRKQPCHYKAVYLPWVQLPSNFYHHGLTQSTNRSFHALTQSHETVEAETLPQGASPERVFAHALLLLTLPLIITSHVTFNIVELPPGLLKARQSRNGRQMVPFCGSAAIVRISCLLSVIIMIVDLIPRLQRIQGKQFFGTHLPSSSSYEIYIINKLGHHRGHYAYAK